MKTFTKVLFVSIAFFFGACDENSEEALPEVTDQYVSMTDFYLKNGAPLQSFTVDASVGGTFVSAKGSRVEVPPDAFVTVSNNPIVGSVTIEFRDIYKKSDMVLSDKPTMGVGDVLLKSAGEFFIKATQNHQELQLAAGKKLDIFTPEDTATDGDSAMAPFILGYVFDPYTNSAFGWISTAGMDTVRVNATQYIYSLYASSSPPNGGSWHNFDDPIYFTSFAQTSLVVHALDSLSIFDTQVFVLFHDVNAVAPLFLLSASDFYLFNAPQGTESTIVAIGVKNGKLYSSFIPISISPNQTINFSLSETTTTAFKAQLRALD